MNLYKVSFNNNHAVSANEVQKQQFENVHCSVSTVKGLRQVNWLVVFAENETNCIAFANEVVSNLLKSLH